MASDQIHRKRRQVAWSECVVPLPDNPVISVLAAYGIPSTGIYGQRCTGFDLTGEKKFEDYDVYIYGVSKDEQLPRTYFDWTPNGCRGYYCWQIQIYWRNYKPRIEAMWCEECETYHVETDWVDLSELDVRVIKGMNEGMKILLQISERRAIRARGGDTRSKYKWTEGEKKKLQTIYSLLLSRIRAARKWYRKKCRDESRQVAYDMVRAKSPEFLDGLIRRLCYLHTRDRDPYKWKASNLAIEYAARASRQDYRPYSLKPRQLRKYLPKPVSKK